jgi:hypothetical protein
MTRVGLSEWSGRGRAGPRQGGMGRTVEGEGLARLGWSEGAGARRAGVPSSGPRREGLGGMVGTGRGGGDRAWQVGKDWRGSGRIVGRVRAGMYGDGPDRNRRKGRGSRREEVRAGEAGRRGMGRRATGRIGKSGRGVGEERARPGTARHVDQG